MVRPLSSSRRDFLRAGAALAAAATLGGRSLFAQNAKPLFEISLAEWSLHRALFEGKREHLNFALDAKNEFGIHAVEYVNQFFKDKAKDTAYLDEMKKRAADNGVKSLLIMIDGEGRLGDPNEGERTKAVENHYKWIEAAKHLGCHSIRVNAASEGTFTEQMKLAADGLRRLSEFAAQHGLNVIVENHGGLSSNGAWLAGVMHHVNLANCGTLPDFGNFRVQGNVQFDRYRGVELLMPFAKAVSAKSHDFDPSGNEIHTDYKQMMAIVLSFGYSGYVGIEYEGSQISEVEGIKATKALLEKVRQELA